MTADLSFWAAGLGAVLLPILALQDLVGVAAFRRHCEPRVVGLMLPGALLGIAAGWAFASVLPMIALMAALGLVSIASWLWRLARRAWPGDGIARPWPAWAATPCGFASGFASQIGNAGGPPYQLWAGSQRLTHLEYIGSNAVLFACINWAKLPAYAALGQFTTTNLRLSAILLPAAFLSTLAGIALVKRVASAKFFILADVLMIAIGLKLLVPALG